MPLMPHRSPEAYVIAFHNYTNLNFNEEAQVWISVFRCTQCFLILFIKTVPGLLLQIKI